MVNGIFPASFIQRVAVGEEWRTALFFDEVRYHFGIIGPEVSEIPQLPEVHLDCNEFAPHIYASDSGGAYQPVHLVREAIAQSAAHVGEENFGIRHAMMMASRDGITLPPERF